MNPGVSHSDTIGSRNASHSRRKSAALSAAVGVDRAAEVMSGLLAISPTGRPSMRTSAVTIPTPKSARSSSTEPRRTIARSPRGTS